MTTAVECTITFQRTSMARAKPKGECCRIGYLSHLPHYANAVRRHCNLSAQPAKGAQATCASTFPRPLLSPRELEATIKTHRLGWRGAV